MALAATAVLSGARWSANLTTTSKARCRPRAARNSMIQTVFQETRPWERPLWRAAPAKGPIFAYLISIHVLTVIGLILFPVPSATVLISTLALTALGGLGTTVCYHRLLAHRTFRLNKSVEHVLIFWATFNGSGTPATWVAYHRQHHAHADTPEDVSSPKQGGFWWAHLRWLYQAAPADVQRWCPELNRGVYKYWKYAELPMILFSLSCGLTLGWEGFFWMGAIRLSYSLHMQCLVNSLTHLGPLRRQGLQPECLVAGTVSTDRVGRKLAQEPPHLRRLGAPRAALVADRCRLVRHLRPGGRRPCRERQTTERTDRCRSRIKRAPSC